MIVYFGDLHIKESQPHRGAALNFLNWMLKNYKNDVVISGGDLFDSSSINHTLMDEVIKILIQFDDFRIVSGNHEISKRMGSILQPLRNHSNIIIYDEETEVHIDDIRFLILPHSYDNKKYENITKETIKFIDYSLSHFTPIQEAFSEDDGVELKFNVEVAHIFSHIHKFSLYTDNFGNDVLIAGSVLNTRQGEQDWPKNMYVLKKDKYLELKVPDYFTYKDIEYGEELEESKDIINVKNAPSIQSVYDKYPKAFIRDAGITLEAFKDIKTENDEDLKEQSIQKKFEIFAIDQNLDEELKNVCHKYLGDI